MGCATTYGGAIDYVHKLLKQSGRSPHTIRAYLSDLTSSPHGSEGLTERQNSPLKTSLRLDMTSCRSHLMNVAQRKPAGVNRALSSILLGLLPLDNQPRNVQANPTDQVSQAKQAKTLPKALCEQDLNRLLRQANFQKSDLTP